MTGSTTKNDMGRDERHKMTKTCQRHRASLTVHFSAAKTSASKGSASFNRLFNKKCRMKPVSLLDLFVIVMFGGHPALFGTIKAITFLS